MPHINSRAPLLQNNRRTVTIDCLIPPNKFTKGQKAQCTQNLLLASVCSTKDDLPMVPNDCDIIPYQV